MLTYLPGCFSHPCRVLHCCVGYANSDGDTAETFREALPKKKHSSLLRENRLERGKWQPFDTVSHHHYDSAIISFQTHSFFLPFTICCCCFPSPKGSLLHVPFRRYYEKTRRLPAFQKFQLHKTPTHKFPAVRILPRSPVSRVQLSKLALRKINKRVSCP